LYLYLLLRLLFLLLLLIFLLLLLLLLYDDLLDLETAMGRRAFENARERYDAEMRDGVLS